MALTEKEKKPKEGKTITKRNLVAGKDFVLQGAVKIDYPYTYKKGEKLSAKGNPVQVRKILAKDSMKVEQKGNIFTVMEPITINQGMTLPKGTVLTEKDDKKLITYLKDPVMGHPEVLGIKRDVVEVVIRTKDSDSN